MRGRPWSPNEVSLKRPVKLRNTSVRQSVSVDVARRQDGVKASRSRDYCSRTGPEDGDFVW
jgi:hypothetical protein